MKKILFFICIALLSTLAGYAQTVNIFVSSYSSSYPDVPHMQATYEAAGFTTVNITSGTLDASLTPANYQVAVINEYYEYISGVFVPIFLTETQRQQVQDYITAGGHVIWVAESWDVEPVTGAPAAANLNAITTINNLFGTSLAYGIFYNNMGMGSPNIPRTHPDAGPGSLSNQDLVVTSGSYATLLNVDACNHVYSADGYDNTTTFDACNSTTVALYPAQPISSEGSVLLSTEALVPFTGTPLPVFPPVMTYNDVFDLDVAAMHYKLLTGAAVVSTCTNCKTVNPIQLLSFQAELTASEIVDLTWATGTEQNNDYFSIEVSQNATDWKEIAKVNSVHNSNTVQNYSAQDPAPKVGVNYYRLKQVDFDGKYSYSDTKLIVLESNGSFIHIQPNPATEFIYLNGKNLSWDKMVLYNNLGQSVNNRIAPTTVNEDQIKIDISALPIGIYYLVGENINEKIVKK